MMCQRPQLPLKCLLRPLLSSRPGTAPASAPAAATAVRKWQRQLWPMLRPTRCRWLMAGRQRKARLRRAALPPRARMLRSSLGLLAVSRIQLLNSPGQRLWRDLCRS